MKSRYVLGVGGCVCVCVCIRAWLSTLFNTVEVGWLGLRLANGSKGGYGWGSAIAPSYRFPHEGLPYHPCPERSPFFSHPWDTLLPPFPLPPQPPFPSLLHLLSLPYPSLPFFHIHPALCRATFNQGGGGLQRFSLSLRKHTHTHTQCVCVYAQFAKTVFPV